MPPFLRGYTRFLCLDDSKRSPVTPEKHIVAEPFTCAVRHPFDLYLYPHFPCDADIFFITDLPSRLTQVQVNINFPCPRLAHILGALCIEFCSFVYPLLEDLLGLRFDLNLLLGNRFFFGCLPNQGFIERRIILYQPQ